MPRVRWWVGCAVILSLFVGFFPAAAQTPAAPIVIGVLDSFTNLAPADSGDFPTWELLSHLHTGLSRYNPLTASYDLALAASHSASTDGLTHTFTIRPEAAFNDGTPITAQTFVDSITRVLTLRGRGAAIIRPYVKAVAVTEAGALVFTLSAPCPYFLGLVALPPYAPLHPASYAPQRLTPTPDTATLITNGLYRLVKRTATELTLVPDPAWRGDLAARLPVTLRYYALPADLREALLAGEIDLARRDVPGGADALNYTAVTEADPLARVYLIFSLKEEPYNDPAARTGVMHLIKREALTEGVISTTTLLPIQISAGLEMPTFPPYDLKAAEDVLKAANYSRYRQVSTELQTASRLYGELYRRNSDILSSALNGGQIVRLGRFETEPAVFLDQLQRGAFRLMLITWRPLVAHPDAYLRPLFAGDVAVAMGYTNPALQAALNTAALSTEPDVVKAAYEDVLRLALADAVVIPLWGQPETARLHTGITVEGAALFPMLHYEMIRRP